MSRERFVADLARVAPGIPTCIADPGDVFEVTGGVVRHLPGASPVATMAERDAARLRFDPTSTIPPLADPNADGYAPALIEGAVTSCLEGMLAFVRDAYAAGDPIIDEYRRLGATYALHVVFPNGEERWHRIVFGAAPTTDGSRDATVVHAITGSSVTAWMLRDKTHFFRRAFSRRLSTLCAIDTGDDGEIRVRAAEVRDLLEYYLNVKSPRARSATREWVDRQLQPFLNQPVAR